MRIYQRNLAAGAIACAATAALVLYFILRDLSGLRKELGALSAYAADSRGQGASALDRLAARLEARIETEAAASGAASDRALAALSSRVSSLSERIAGLSSAIGESRSDGGLGSFDAALDGRIRQADAAYRSGSYGEAAAAYAALLAWAPQEDLFLERRAVSLYRANPADSGNYRAVERDLKTLLYRGSAGAEALEILALISIERGEWEEAVEGFEELLDSRPGDIGLLVAACDCALLADDEAAAARFLELARVPERDDQKFRLELERIRSRLSGGVGAAR